MDKEQRKAVLQLRQRMRQYPRRSQAVFTDENDHNPIVLQDCPHCHRGKKCRRIKNGYALERCKACKGLGLSGEIEPYYPEDTELVEATPSENGWVRCPGCSRRFLLTDGYAWTGLRHRRCGQKIRIVQ